MKTLLLFGITSGLLLSSPIYAAKVSKVPDIMTSTITGQGFLKTQGGDVKTCAGNEVYLEPFIDEKNWTYQKVIAAKRGEAAIKNFSIFSAKRIVSSGMGDKKDYRESREKPVEEIESKYDYRTLSDNLVLKTQCDAGGNFEFTNLKQGKYIIATKVTWKTDEWQGGSLSKIIEVNQDKQKVFLTE